MVRYSSTAVWVALIVSGSVGPLSARAQATYSEDFDALGSTSNGSNGPIGLVSRGWQFRNQSARLGAGSYSIFSHDVNPILPNAHSGTYYLGVTDAAAQLPGDALSAWALLPTIANQRAGDLITFAAYTHVTTSRLEVRYSPNGGTNTGSGPTALGDFTVLLGTISAATDAWVQAQFTVPGTGRLAFRYTGQRAAFNGFDDFLGIDALSVGVPPPPPCNMPPIPGAGQTVHWSAANSPFRICQSITISSGSTVIVDAGVRIDVDAGQTVTLRGTMVMQGTTGTPIFMNAAAVYPPMLAVDGGTLQATFAQFGGQVRPLAGGSLAISDSGFNGPNGVVFTDLYAGTGFGRFDRVTFNNSELTISNYTLVLRDVTLTNSVSRLIRDYAFMSNVTADGKGIDIDAGLQGTLLDTITVRNVTSPPGGQTVSTGYGLGLGEGNFLIGPDVTLTNNTYPVRIVSAGILPGSVLPPSGNMNNRIYVPGRDHHGSSIWADAGIPYYIPDFYSQRGGSLRIVDGVHVQIASGAGMAADPSYVAVFGTKERPVTFDPAAAGGAWYPLQLFYRIRHAILDGATRGASWPASFGWGFLDSSIVRNCTEYGVTGQAIVRKTLFQANATAASVSFNNIDLLGDTNPNAFEGNTVGVAAAGNARNNWWNSPTGPTSPDNPGGTGDSKAGGIPFLPFRTTRPDFNDAPPIVDLERHAALAHPGNKLILTWKARDDGTIVSQRILLSPDGDIVQGNLNEPVIVLGDHLPGTQRSFEFVMPAPATRVFGSSNIRVEATDDAGQIGWDDLHIYAERDEPGQLVLNSPSALAVTAGADMGQVCWQAQGINPTGGSINAYLLLENSGTLLSLGGVTTYLSCLSGNLTAPFVSTDRARIVLTLFTGGGVAQPEYYYGPIFSIRPDGRLGNAPPAVTITSPAAGASVAGGAVLPIAWTSSDDEQVRYIHIQVSVDGGRTWSFAARDIPGATNSYNWPVPPSGGTPDVRIKVIAVDRWFQDSSDQRTIAITAGQGAIPGDIDGNGIVNAADAQTLVNVLLGLDQNAAHIAASDLDQSGVPDGMDIQPMVNILR